MKRKQQQKRKYVRFAYSIQIGTYSNVSFYRTTPPIFLTYDAAEKAAFKFMKQELGIPAVKASRKYVHIRRELVVSEGKHPYQTLRELHNTKIPRARAALNAPRTKDGLAMFDSHYNRKRAEWVRVWGEAVVLQNRGQV